MPPALRLTHDEALSHGDATAGFAWYLSSGLSKYRLVYGSLGSIVALMFWLYVTSGIILFGAHLSAAIQYVRRMRTDDGAEIDA